MAGDRTHQASDVRCCAEPTVGIEPTTFYEWVQWTAEPLETNASTVNVTTLIGR